MSFPQSELARQRFTDIELIGKGAFGNVYRAVDRRLRRLVAIKEIQANLEPGERELACQRFEREAQIVAQLNSPQIVAVYGYDEDLQQGEQYLYLEYVAGGTLATALRNRGRLTERETILVARDVARAIAAHWAIRVVHRDIKPSNILLLCEDGGAIIGAKLTDYGIAQDLRATQRTRVGQGHPGTPSYMSPEQASSQRALTAASDIYNVGVLLWEMLTGTPYYEQQNPSITKATLGTSQQLVAIIQRALEPDLTRRYADPLEFVCNLEVVLTKLPTNLPQSISQSASPAQPHLRRAGVLAGILLLIGVSGWVMAGVPGSRSSTAAEFTTSSPTQQIVAVVSSPTATGTREPTLITTTAIPPTAANQAATAISMPPTVTNIPPTQIVAPAQPTRRAITATSLPQKATIKPTATRVIQRTATAQAQQPTIPTRVSTISIPTRIPPTPIPPTPVPPTPIPPTPVPPTPTTASTIYRLDAIEVTEDEMLRLNGGTYNGSNCSEIGCNVYVDAPRDLWVIYYGQTTEPGSIPFARQFPTKFTLITLPSEESISPLTFYVLRGWRGEEKYETVGNHEIFMEWSKFYKITVRPIP